MTVWLPLEKWAPKLGQACTPDLRAVFRWMAG